MIFNLDRLETAAHALELRGVRYRMGAKVRDLSLQSLRTVERLDCSGFAQLMTWYAANIEIVSGTAWDQYHELRESAIREHAGEIYSKACLNYEALLMCFIHPTELHAGHVWFCHDGRTFESHGGGGVASRHWNTPVLMRECSAILVMETA